MKESIRLDYLDAMGIDSFVPTMQLLGAKPSMKLRLSQKLYPAAGELSQDSAASVSVILINNGLDAIKHNIGAEAQSGSPVVHPVRVEEPVVTKDDSRTKSQTLRFSLLVVRCGGMLWVDNLPESRGVDREYLQLVFSLCRALGKAGPNPEFEVFDWPLVKNSQIDQGKESATQSVEAFITRQLKKHVLSELILLGDHPVNHENYSADIVYRTVSLWAMLTNPGLKSKAWQDLRPLTMAQ